MHNLFYELTSFQIKNDLAELFTIL